jgi:exosome complex component RRP41
MKKDAPQLMNEGKRNDGRGPNDLRKITIETGVIKNAEGSAHLKWGSNEVIAAVYGPKEALPRHFANPERAIIKCRYVMAPFSSLEEHGRSGQNRRATEISKVTKEVFENVVMLERFPGCEIDIFVEILQSDGGTRSAGITAAAVALASSGVPMRDIPYAVSVGKSGEHMVLDLNKLEDTTTSEADMPVAISPRTGDILLLQMDGSFTVGEFKRGMSMVREAGAEIVQLQRAALEKKYTKGRDGNHADEN